RMLDQKEAIAEASHINERPRTEEAEQGALGRVRTRGPGDTRVDEAEGEQGREEVDEGVRPRIGVTGRYHRDDEPQRNQREEPPGRSFAPQRPREARRNPDRGAGHARRERAQKPRTSPEEIFVRRKEQEWQRSEDVGEKGH